MTMPDEVRIGRHVPSDMQDKAEDVIRLVHAEIALDSARIYAKSAATYILTIVPKGRTTLVTFEFRTHDKSETRAQIVLDVIREHKQALAAADIQNAAPIMVERTVAAYTHPAGDGAWFRTAVRHVARRTQLLRRGGVTPAWPEVSFGYEDVMQNDGKNNIRFIGRGTPGLVGMKITLPADTPVLRSLDDVEGVTADELIDHPLVNGAGLIVKKAWKSETRDKSLGRISIIFASDPIPLDEAAHLIDRMRARSALTGVLMGRTEFRAKDAGYEHLEGASPEQARKWFYRDTWLRSLSKATDEPIRYFQGLELLKTYDLPDITKDAQIATLLDFIRSKGLEQEWKKHRDDALLAQSQLTRPAVTIDRTEEDGGRYQYAYINITPWLLTAAAEDIVQLVQLGGDLHDNESEERIFIDTICRACDNYRTDRDDEYHIQYPDYWRYDIQMTSLRKEIVALMHTRRPDIAEAVEQAADAAH